MTKRDPLTTELPLIAAPAAPKSRRAAVGTLVLWLLLFAGLAVPPLVMGDNDYRMAQFAKYLSLAILALGVDLIWGYTGMLSLGQGLYFGLGAYCLAYGLEMQQVAEDEGVAPGVAPPKFMNSYIGFSDPKYVEPWALKYIAPLANTWVALAAAIIVPVIAATLFGLVTFRLRIRGVYFALITQALLLAVWTLVLNQQLLTGGFVGIKNLADLELFGYKFNDARQALPMYYLTAGVLVVCLAGCWALVHSKVGKVLTAIRDNENRVLALGYNTAVYKVFIFALAGGLGGVAGALYTAANGLAGPGYLDVPFSIFAVVLVAVGGRGTLFGPVLGAVLVSVAKDRISELTVGPFVGSEYWPIVLGLLFIAVVLLLPDGVLGGLKRVAHRLTRGRRPLALQSPLSEPRP